MANSAGARKAQRNIKRARSGAVRQAGKAKLRAATEAAFIEAPEGHDEPPAVAYVPARADIDPEGYEMTAAQINNDALWPVAGALAEVDWNKAAAQVGADEGLSEVAATELERKGNPPGFLNGGDHREDYGSREGGSRKGHIREVRASVGDAISDLEEATGMARGQAVSLISPKHGGRAPKMG